MALFRRSVFSIIPSSRTRVTQIVSAKLHGYSRNKLMDPTVVAKNQILNPYRGSPTTSTMRGRQMNLPKIIFHEVNEDSFNLLVYRL